MVGIRLFPFGARPIFRGYVKLQVGNVLFSKMERMVQNRLEFGIDLESKVIITCTESRTAHHNFHTRTHYIRILATTNPPLIFTPNLSTTSIWIYPCSDCCLPKAQQLPSLSTFRARARVKCLLVGAQDQDARGFGVELWLSCKAQLHNERQWSWVKRSLGVEICICINIRIYIYIERENIPWIFHILYI